MTRSLAFIFVLFLMPVPASAQVLFGQARAVDGDTLVVGDSYVRLHGIDAIESGQQCVRAGQPWACGQEAEAFLAGLVTGTTVQCKHRDRDSYGRDVATCRVNGRDLSQLLVDAGYAVALRQYSDAYVSAEERARSSEVGIWASEFQNPADYRAEHPQAALPLLRRQEPEARSHFPIARSQSRQPLVPHSTYYANCAAARSAGAAPLRIGEPGYRPQLDADGDGVACEPYRGR